MKQKLTYLILLVILTSCYKDTDMTVVEEVVRPPKINVDGYLYGTYITADGGQSTATHLSIQDELLELENGTLPLSHLEHVKKEGEFLELLADGQLIGAAQIVVIENQVNYYELITIPAAMKEHFDGNIDLNEELKLTANHVVFSNVNGDVYSGDVDVEYIFSKERNYNDQLVSYAFNKNGRRVVVDVQESFYIGFKSEMGERLQISAGGFSLNSSLDEGEIFHYSKEEKEWVWVTEVRGGINTVALDVAGYYVIGSSAEAVLLDGEISLEDAAIAGQEVKIESNEKAKKLFTSSEGRFFRYVAKGQRYEVLAENSDGVLLFTADYVTTENRKVDMILDPGSIPPSFIRSDFKIISCEGEVSEERELKIKYADDTAVSFSLLGDDEAWLPAKNQVFKISSGDGPALEWDLQKGAIHYLSDCADDDEGFTFVKIRGDSKVYDAFQENRQDGRSSLSSGSAEFRLIVEASEPGVFSQEMVNISISDIEFGEQGYFISCENASEGCGIEVCEVTHFQIAGDEWTRVYFQGKLWMQTISPPQAGNFPVEGIILTKK